MAGAQIFGSMFEMIMHGAQQRKQSASEAFAQYFTDGGFRHTCLAEGPRLTYRDADGSVKFINVLPGGTFSARQLNFMMDPELFNVMITAKVRCARAMIRIDYVSFIDETTKQMRPTTCSKLITVIEKTKHNDDCPTQYGIFDGVNKLWETL